MSASKLILAFPGPPAPRPRLPFLLEQRILEKLQPYEAQVNLLDEIPGVDRTLAAVIIAEMGVDMSVFQSVSQLASWVGCLSGQQRIRRQA